MVKDYYKILGVPRNATKEEIKKAYLKLAKQYHPDLKGKQFEEKFKEINEAYKVLSNDKSRQYYDRFGQAPDSNNFDQQDFGFNFNSDFSGFNSGFGFDFQDIFDDFFGDFFGSRNFHSKHHNKQMNIIEGEDIILDLDLELKDVVDGSKKTIKYYRLVKCNACNGTGAYKGTSFETCDACNGTGQIRIQKRTPFGLFTTIKTCHKCNGLGKIITKKCDVCKGTGRIKKLTELEINIPAGIDNNSKLRIMSKGNEGINASNGDLYLSIRIKPHPYFKRKGKDLIYEPELSFYDFIKGKKLKIKGLKDEDITIEIPKYSQPYADVIIKGKGILSDYGRGNLIIKPKIILPNKLSKKAEKLLDELNEELNRTKSYKRKFFGLF